MEEKKFDKDINVRSKDDTDIGVGMIVDDLEANIAYMKRNKFDEMVVDREDMQNYLDLIHRLQSDNAEQKAEIERLTEREKFLENAWHTSIEHTETVERGLKASEARSTELQKQVDELKRENAKVISFNDALYREKEQAVKDTAKDILGELDLFFKGTTFRKGYEFKKINQKLKEIAERKGVEVE